MYHEVKLFQIVDPGSSLALLSCVRNMVKQFLRIKTAPALLSAEGVYSWPSLPLAGADFR